MKVRVRIDKGGRIVLPKRVREQLRLAAGDEMELESMDDRITLRPVRGTAQLRKKCGVWVFRCGEPIMATTVDETIDEVRRERENCNRCRSHSLLQGENRDPTVKRERRSHPLWPG